MLYVSTDDTEQFLVVSEAKAKDTETLKISLELLETSQPLLPLLDRNTKVCTYFSYSMHTHNIRTDAGARIHAHTHIHTHTQHIR